MWVQLVLIVELRESNDEKLNQSEVTCLILRVLRRITGERGQPIPPSDGSLARREPDEVKYLLRWLLSSNYSNGALDIAELCLAWENYNHPAKEDVLVRLRELGSRQHWFLPTSGPSPLPICGSYVGFGDDDTDLDLEQWMGSLSLENSSTSFANIAQADVEE